MRTHKAAGGYFVKPFTKGIKHKRTALKRVLDMQGDQGLVLSAWAATPAPKKMDKDRINFKEFTAMKAKKLMPLPLWVSKRGAADLARAVPTPVAVPIPVLPVLPESAPAKAKLVPIPLVVAPRTSFGFRNVMRIAEVRE